MNYINLLTKEEKAILCGIITGKEFKELFKYNEQDFAKIRKGFRAKTLSEPFALSIAIANIDKPFISIWVNRKINTWLNSIHENVEKLKKEGLAHDVALADTILESAFVNHVSLYFKLTKKPMDTDTISRIHERMYKIRSEFNDNVKVVEQIKVAEEKNRELSEQIKVINQNMDAREIEYKQEIQKIEDEKNKLELMLTEAQNKIAESKNKYDDINYLKNFDDRNNSLLSSVTDDNFISLCGIVSDYNGQKRLIRYADLNSNGQYSIFIKNERIPPYFENRDKIFYKDESFNEGYYGIWSWSATPNASDPSKDYVLSEYNMDFKAIEVITISEASSLDDLLNVLKNEVEYEPHSYNIVFSFYIPQNQYIGVLCNKKQLNTLNGKTKLIEDCIELPVYEFTKENILHLDNGLSFYRSAFMGIPNKICRLKSDMDIVKDIVLSSITWTTYKTRNMTHSEYKTFREFITGIPIDNVISKIQTICHCSSSDAKKLLDEFIGTVYNYMDGTILEDEIIISAISKNTELQEKTKLLIRNDWEEENKRLIDEKQSKLDSLSVELQSVINRLSEAQKELEKTKTEEEYLTNMIAEKEKLAKDVEIAVNEKIQKACENAADFIANIAFFNGQQIQFDRSRACELTNKPANVVSATYHVSLEFENLNDIQVHHSWKDVINTLAFELMEAGVSEKYQNGLAAFLCAAYIERQPILLVGPNAIDIVKAFSASVTAHKYGTLYCDGNYNNQIIEKIGENEESIVIINNLIQSGWINMVPEIITQKDIFYIATHPYVEDIQVEPKSLYCFMLPLFTEFFVDKKATGQYYGGYFADDFEEYSPSKGVHKELRVLSKFSITSLVRNQINNIITTMHGIYPDTTTDEEFLFGILPITYASMEMNKLSESIADLHKDVAISASLKRDLQYILGEN